MQFHHNSYTTMSARDEAEGDAEVAEAEALMELANGDPKTASTRAPKVHWDSRGIEQLLWNVDVEKPFLAPHGQATKIWEAITDRMASLGYKTKWNCIRKKVIELIQKDSSGSKRSGVEDDADRQAGEYTTLDNVIDQYNEYLRKRDADSTANAKKKEQNQALLDAGKKARDAAVEFLLSDEDDDDEGDADDEGGAEEDAGANADGPALKKRRKRGKVQKQEDPFFNYLSGEGRARELEARERQVARVEDFKVKEEEVALKKAELHFVKEQRQSELELRQEELTIKQRESEFALEDRLEKRMLRQEELALKKKEMEVATRERETARLEDRMEREAARAEERRAREEEREERKRAREHEIRLLEMRIRLAEAERGPTREEL